MKFKKYQAGRIYKKTLFTFSIILSITVLVIGSISYFVSSNTLAKKINMSNTQEAKQISQSIDYVMDKIDTMLLSIINDPILKKDYDELSIEEKLLLNNGFFSKFQLDNCVNSIYIYYYSNEKVVASNKGVVDVRDMEDTAWLKNCKDAYPLYINTSKIYRESGDISLITRMSGFPMNSANEKGAVIVNIDKRKLFKNIDNNTLILDQNGNLIWGATEFYQNLNNTQKFKDAINKTDQSSVIKLRKSNKLISILSKSNSGFMYVKSTNMKELYLEIKILRNIMLALALLSLIIGFIIAKKSIGEIYKPMSLLLNRLTDNQSTPNENVDEIEQLDNIFNSILENKNYMENFYKESKHSILQGVLLNLCYGNVTNKEFVLKQLNMIEFPIIGRRFMAMIIQIENSSSENLDSSIFRNLGLYYNKSTIDIITTYMKDDKIVLLVSFERDNQEIMVMAKSIQNALRNDYELECSIGLGNDYEDLMNYKLSFREALDVLSYKTPSSKGNIIHISEYITSGETAKYYYPLQKELEIMEAVKLAHKDKAMEIILEIYNSILLSTTDTKYISSLLWQVMNSLIRSISSIGIEYDQITGRSFSDDFAAYNELRETEKMFEFIKNKLIEITNFVMTKRNFNNDLITTKIKEYIDKNYVEDLSIDTFSAMTMLSNNYISNLYRASQGVGIKEYITNVRMDKAAKLLKTTELPINSIAKMVGYENPRTFFRNFKNYFTLTPSEYRKFK